MSYNNSSNNSNSYSWYKDYANYILKDNPYPFFQPNPSVTVSNNNNNNNNLSSYYNNKTKDNETLSKANTILGGINTGIGSALGIFGALTAFDQLQLAKEQLDFEKQSYNKNLANSATAYNTNLQRVANLNAQNLGLSGKDATDYVNNYINQNKADGSTIQVKDRFKIFGA